MRDNEFEFVQKSTDLIGYKVVNPAGEHLGKIEDILIDCNSGHMTYVILSFGGFLGIGDKLFAIPWSSLKINVDEKNFTLDEDKETLKKAPGFKKEQWLDTQSRDFMADIYKHYSANPFKHNSHKSYRE